MNDNAKTKKQLIEELNELRQRLTALTQSGKQPADAAVMETLRRQNEYLAALHETTLDVVRHLDLNELLQAIISRAAALVGTSHGYIYLVDAQQNEMKLEIGIGLHSESIGHRIKPGEGIAGRVWLSGEPLVIEDYKHWEGRPPAYEQSVLQTAMGVPLKSGDQVIGVIGLAYVEPGRTFGQAEVEILTRFAQLAALALDNARLFEKTRATLAENETLTRSLQKQALQLQTAGEVARAATSILDLNELLTQTVELIRERFDLYYAGIFLVDRAGRYAVLRAGTGEAGRQMLQAGHKLEVGGTSMIGWCVANAQGRIALDVGKEAVRFSNPYLPETRSELALPLIARGRAIGAMTIQSAQPAAFSDADIATLQTMADQIANAIENARLFRETQRRISELSRLSEIGQVFSSALQVEALPEIIYQQVGRLFDTDSFYVALYDAERDEWTTAFDIVRGQRQPPTRFKTAAGLTGYIIRTRQALVLRTAQESEAFYRDHDIPLVGELAKSWMGVPLVAADQVLGVMAIESYEQENHYDEHDLTLFSTIAGQAASAIQNARLFQETRRRLTRLSILSEIGQAFSSSLDLDSLLEVIYQQFSRIFDTTNFFIATYQEGSDEWRLAFQVEQGERQPPAVRKLGVGLTSHILQTRQPILLRNLAENTAFFEKHHITRSGTQAKSWMGVPLIAGGQIAGVMAIQSYEQENLYDEQDLALFSTIATQAATAIQNARLFDQARQRVTELSILNEIGRAVAASLKLDELLEVIHQQVGRVFDASSFFITTYEEGSDHWNMIFYRERGQPGQLGPRPLGVGLTSHILRTGQPVLLKSAEELITFQVACGVQPSGETAKSWMGVPQIVAGKVVGTMTIQSYDQENLYTPQDLALFSTIAAQAATAIQNARLFEETSKRVNELALLNEISRSLSTALNLDELMETVYQQVGRIFDTTNFYIATHLQEGDEWRMAFEVAHGQRQPPVSRKLETGMTGHIIRTRQPLLLRNLDEVRAFHQAQGITPAFTTPGEWATAYLGVPLIAADRVIGVMAVRSFEQENLYTHQDLALFSTIGAQVAIAIQNAHLFEQARQRLNELATLNEIGQAFSAALQLEELPEVIYQQVRRLFDANSFYIAFYDATRDTWTTAFDILRGERQPPMQLKSEAGLTGYIIRTRQPLLLQDAQTSLDFHAQHGIEMVGENSKSWMGTPLIIADQIVGVMAIEDYERENLFGPHELALFSAVASQAAIAVQNARLFKETQQRIEQTQLLLRVSEAAASTLDSTEVMRRVAREAARALGADMAGAYLLDETGKFMRPVAGYHVPPQMLQEFMGFYPPLEGNPFIEEGCRTRRSVFTGDAPNDPRLDLEIRQALHAQSVLMTPMIVKDAVIGGLWLIWWQESHPFSQDELTLVEGIIRQAGVAVENARLFHEMQARADEMAALNELSRSLTTRLNIDDALNDIYQGAVKLFGQRASNFYAVLYDPDRQQARFALNVVNGHLSRPYTVALAGSGLTGYVLRTREAVLIQDHMAEWLAARGIEAARRPDAPPEWPRAWMGAPMIVGEQPVGMLAMSDYSNPRAYNEHDRELLVTLAGQAAITIQNIRLFEETRTRAEEMAALNELSRSLTSRLKVEEVLNEAYHGASRLVDTTNFYISIYNPATDEVTFPLEVKEGQVTRPYGTQSARRGLTGYLIQHRQPLLLQEAASGKEEQLGVETIPFVEGKSSQCWLGVPLIAGERVLGTMAIMNMDDPYAFDEHDRDLLQAVGNQIAIALQNALLFEEQQQARALLSARVKELDCLNDIGRKINETPTLPDFLQWAAERIPQAMQYPDICRVAIEYDGQLYGAPEAVHLPHQMVGGLYFGNQQVGQIYIAYTEKRDFLNEESALLGDIVRRISGYIENRRLFEEIRARARHEQILREITARVRGSNEAEAIMHTAVRELGHALGRPTFIRLGRAEELARPPADSDTRTQ